MKTPTHYGGTVLAATVSTSTIKKDIADGNCDATIPTAESGYGIVLEIVRSRTVSGYEGEITA